MRRLAAAAVVALAASAAGEGAPLGPVPGSEGGAPQPGRAPGVPVTTLRVPGLQGPVEIIVDRWGIPHIYAETEADLFFAQGYNAARDRLFLLELWRRRATGTVAEILGRRALERDVGARLFRFRGDLRQELRHYHPRGEAIVGAFVRGINAYIDTVLQRPELLPLEFRLLGIVPGKWSPEVVVSRHQGLVGNVRDELRYGRAVALLGPERVRELSNFEPGEPELALDPAIDAGLLSADVLRLYVAHRRPIDFRPEDIVDPRYRAAAPSVATAREGPAAWLLGRPGPPAPPALEGAGAGAGSNNWVVSGRLSQSGHPIMANDPHRALSAPSLRYWAHLVGPGWNVIGAGEPTVPGVSIGHNEHGAWGLTVFATDSEDLYVYETSPSDPHLYRYRGRWEPMTVIREAIPVRGEEPVVVELKYTRHGPVVYEDPRRRVAYAVRAAWLEVGGAPYLASLRMDQARSWEEFREACSYSNIPGENMVWAGRDGDIGWQAVGIAPIRRHWSGLVPVPGDGRYEWDGYLPIKARPHVLNPPEGFFATANNNLIPPGYPHPEAVAFTWAAPYRWARISEVLASGRRHSMLDMMELQTDLLSIPARTLVPLLRHLSSPEPMAERARRVLLGWDHVLEPESVAAGIYVAWERRLQRRVTELFVPEEARELLRVPLEVVIEWLLAPPGRFGDDPVAARDRLLAASLEEAVGELAERFGPEIEGWRYGQLGYKHVLIRHPLSAAVSAELRRRLDVGPAPRGGYAHTVNSTGSADLQASGASFRIIVDTGDWDRTLGSQSPGQAGDPDGRHYRDLFRMWAEDRYFPVFFSRHRIESVADEIVRLLPAPG